MSKNEITISNERYNYLIDKIEHLEEYISVLEAKNGKKYFEEDIKDIIILD